MSKNKITEPRLILFRVPLLIAFVRSAWKKSGSTREDGEDGEIPRAVDKVVQRGHSGRHSGRRLRLLSPPRRTGVSPLRYFVNGRAATPNKARLRHGFLPYKATLIALEFTRPLCRGGMGRHGLCLAGSKDEPERPSAMKTHRRNARFPAAFLHRSFVHQPALHEHALRNADFSRQPTAQAPRLPDKSGALLRVMVPSRQPILRVGAPRALLRDQHGANMAPASLCVLRQERRSASMPMVNCGSVGWQRLLRCL